MKFTHMYNDSQVIGMKANDHIAKGTQPKTNIHEPKLHRHDLQRNISHTYMNKNYIWTTSKNRSLHVETFIYH